MRISLRRLRDVLLTTPSALLRNGTFLLRRSHPSLKTEGNGFNSCHRFRNCLPQAITGNQTSHLVDQQAQKQRVMAYGSMSADHRPAKKTDRCRHQDPGPGSYGAGWAV